MKRKSTSLILPEYDFNIGSRGKYAKQFAEGSNIILLDPDVLKDFPDAESVNETLRAVSKIAKRTRKKVTV